MGIISPLVSTSYLYWLCRRTRHQLSSDPLIVKISGSAVKSKPCNVQVDRGEILDGHLLHWDVAALVSGGTRKNGQAKFLRVGGIPDFPPCDDGCHYCGPSQPLVYHQWNH